MDRLKALLSKSSRTEKEQRQACGYLKRALGNSDSNMAATLCDVFFCDGVKCFEPSMLRSLYEIIDESNIKDAFDKYAANLIKQVFWEAEKPSICAFVNYCQYGSQGKLSPKEIENFIYIFTHFIFEFSEACFDYLHLAIEEVIASVHGKPALADELVQQLDDAFGMQLPETIISTYLIKAGERNVTLDALCRIFSMALVCLSKRFDSGKLKELRASTSTIFAISLKPERFMLLQSYFANAIQCDDLRSTVIAKCVSMIRSPESTDQLPCLYRTYANVFDGKEAANLVHFMKRDFDQCLAPVRLVLQYCFTEMCKRDENALVEHFAAILPDLLWTSRLKRFVFPRVFIANPTPELVRDLIAASQNHLNKDVVAHSLRGVKDFDTVIDMVLALEGVFSLSMFLSANMELAKRFNERLPSNPYQRISIICDNIYKPNVTMKDFEVGLFASDVKLRVKSFYGLIDAELPKTDADFEIVCKALDESLLTIDVPAEQAVVPKAFEKFVSNVTTRRKKTPALSIEFFMKKMLAICCKRLVPTTNDIQRQISLEMCASIWKRFRTIGERENILQFNSTMKDGQACLKRASIDVSKFIERDDVGKETRMQTKTVETLPPLYCSLAEVRDFRILLEKQRGLKVTHDVVESVVSHTESLSDDWERMCEWYLILAEVKAEAEDIEMIATSLFNALMKTRKAGLVGACSPALQKVLKNRGVRETTIMGFAKTFISSFSDFDMAQMRRSAGLPFISKALMNSSKKVCDVVMNGLLELGENTTNEQEETNVINTLRSAVREIDLGLATLARIFALLFSACYRFKNSWDVISAVDLVYVGLMHKIWNILEGETVFRSLSMHKFFKEVAGSRDIIIRGLSSGNDHAIYLALLVLTLFACSIGDREITALIEQVGISRSSRIRRTAARALMTTLSVDDMQAYGEALVNKLDTDTCNALHFHLLVLYELKECGVVIKTSKQIDTRNCRMISQALHEWLGTERDWKTQNLDSLIQMLKFWKKGRKPSDELISYLISQLIIPDLPEVNRTLQIEGTKFLASHLAPGALTKEQGDIIVSLITRVDSVELQAALVTLLQFSSDLDVSPLIPFFIECTTDPAERFVPLQLAVSTIADEVIKCDNGLQVGLMLMINDIPRVRVQTATKLGMASVNEFSVVNDILSKMSDDEKTAVAKRWAVLVEKRAQEDERGEPMTFFVDELKVVFMCRPDLEQTFWEKAPGTMSANEMRRHLAKIAALM